MYIIDYGKSPSSKGTYFYSLLLVSLSLIAAWCGENWATLLFDLEGAEHQYVAHPTVKENAAQGS